MAHTKSGRIEELSSKRKWLTLVAMVFGLFMPMLDNLVVNVALPTMQRSLQASVSDLQWIIDAYTLTFASFMLTGGSLGDLYGRKKFFMAGLVVFTLASLGCGTASSTEALIAFRAVQGFGAALLLPGSLSILTATFRGRELGAAIGIWAAMSGLAVAVGPLVGGYLVEHHSWESIFFINIPIGLIGLVLTTIIVRESRDWRGTRRIDVPGLLTGTSGLFFLVYALIEGGNRGWTDERILWSFGLSAVLLIVFTVIESKRFSPMLPLAFYRNPTFAASNVVAASVFFALFGTTFFLALYLQNVRGFSPFETGVRLFPFTVAILIISPISGRLSDKYGSRWLMTAGCAIAAGGMALLLRTDPTSSYTTVILPAFLVLGSGMALTMAPMTAAVMGSVDPEHAGIASAATNTTRELGGVLGIALLGAVVTSSFKDRLLEHLVDGGIPSQAAQSIAERASSNAAAGGGSLATFRQQVPPGTSEAVVERVVVAAQNAFVDAIHSGMLIAIGFMLLASLVAAIFVRSHIKSRRDEREGPEPLEGAVATPPLPPEPADSEPEMVSAPVLAEPLAQPDPAPAASPLVRSSSYETRATADVDVLDQLKALLLELPFKAGMASVEDNLGELARSTLHYYFYGLANGSNSRSLPIGVSDDAKTSARHDVTAVSGYLALEQRFGRISADVSPDQAATLLMGALAAHALGLEITGEEDVDSSLEFVTGMVRIMVEGIANNDGQLQRYTRGGVNQLP
jgi:EmrB/QacA subfamily drug resistance transporter